MKLVCLDSHYFGWAIRGTATIGQEDKVSSAKLFFEYLDRSKTVIVVPTPLITELLMEAEVGEHDSILECLERRYFIAEYDTHSAKLAAEIWNAKKRAKVIEQLKKDRVSARTKIKVDTQILAVAISQRCEHLFSEDEDLCKMAANYIPAGPMPQFEVQPSLFS